jgi:uroporphyrinogen decarboxylase
MSERVAALMRGERPDRVPCFPFILGFCARNAGYPVSATYMDAEKSFWSQVWAAEMYGYDTTPIYFYASYGAWEFGGDVRMPSGPFEMAPKILRHPVTNEQELEALELPDPAVAGCLPVAMAFSRLQEKHGYPVIGAPHTGVMTTAANVCGVATLCRWMIKRPELAHKALRLVTDHLVDVVRLWATTFDPGRLLPFIGEPTAANQILSPRQFEEFALPYQRELHEKILDLGVRSVICHICGDQTQNFPYWQQIPFSRDGAPGILSFDHRVSLAHAIELFGRDHIIAGNIEPRLIQDGKPHELYQACVQALEVGKTAPRGYLLMSGCEVPALAPPYNVFTMVKAAREHGAYGDRESRD